MALDEDVRRWRGRLALPLRARGRRHGNASSVRLASLRAGHDGGIFEYVDTGGTETIAAYASFLDRTTPDIVVTASAQGCAFGPRVTQRLVEHAAVSRGYTTIERLPMPDGRELRVWGRTDP